MIGTKKSQWINSTAKPPAKPGRVEWRLQSCRSKEIIKFNETWIELAMSWEFRVIDVMTFGNQELNDAAEDSYNNDLSDPF